MLRVPSPAVFRHAAYRNYWLSRLLTTLGGQIQITAMGWQVYDTARAQGESIQHASLLLGFVGLAQFLPLLALSLFGGQVADRYSRKWIIIISYLVRAASIAVLAAAALQPGGTLLHIIFATAVITGTVSAFMPAAISALAPTLVPREDLPQAIAWSSLCFQTSMIAGPAIGGVLYGFGAPVPYIATLVLMLIGIALLLMLKAPKQETAGEKRTLGMIAEGLKFVFSNKIVLGAMSLDLVVVLLAGAVALLPVFARDILHAGPDEMGVLRSSMGVGAVIIALILAVKPIRKHIGPWMFGATIVFGLATVVFGISQFFWLSAAALAVAGGADMISVYVRQSLIQLATPDAMRGRVGSVSYVFISASNELGDFEAGVMARLLGPVLAVTVGGVGAVAASLAWIKLFPQLTHADSFEPGALAETETAAEVAAVSEGKTA